MDVTTMPPPTAGQLIISEFRLRGPGGVGDEYIELLNASGTDLTIQASDASAGVAVATSDGTIKCVVPNGTVMPRTGHFLCTNAFGYSLGNHPSGNGTTATGDDLFFSGIADNTSLAVFNNATGGASFSAANRIDAVGFTTDANTLYREGAGLPALSTAGVLGTLEYAFVRKMDPVTSRAVDTNDNAADFQFVDTIGADAGAGRRLGAPGPENTTSPVGFVNVPTFPLSKIDPGCVGRGAANSTCSVGRDSTPVGSGVLGTLDIRARITNQTGGSSTRLRFRIVDLSTRPAAGSADLRAMSGSTYFAINSSGSVIEVTGTALENSTIQPNGGGINSAFSPGNITQATPLPNNSSINVHFRFGVAAAGYYRLKLIVDSLPGGSAVYMFAGHTEMQTAPTFDFDGDGKSDIGIFRPLPAAEWWIRRSSDGQVPAYQFGTGTDKIVPADCTGDGKTDIAFWRPSTGEWYVLRSENLSFFSFPFGTTGDIPVPADYDADGKADPAVFRPSNGTWFIQRSSDNGTTIAQLGSNGDVPVAADYDGDGRADMAIYRTALGQWWLNRSTAGAITFNFGTATDKPVQGDFTGDGKADVAFWRPSTGDWFVLRSENLSFYSVPFGVSSDVPIPGDYDGDGKFDTAVFRPSNATWFIQRSSGGTTIVGFGNGSDRPIPNAFVP
jgi:hypothetical protein